ncbi:hypothetical protein [Parasedimentitalea psychrophila]|uniref:Uncharacterized protein n=1 Tax=Parasedimentitalea psychrophila TaxID=2997337 RepID=A0A9Y2KY13_9RHOB|nr:hypothetical protein [Parasedimentitalea psychrophila]WIY23842.1 hypothetical protein QPJ95_14470 [Parasedimentitalea psychrophila]
MPKLIQLYIRNVIIGFAIAAAFVAMLLWFNIMGLWHLVSTSETGLLAVFLLWFMNGIVFAGVQFGWAVMALSDTDSGPRGGTPVAHEFLAIPVPVDRPGQRPHRR